MAETGSGACAVAGARRARAAAYCIRLFVQTNYNRLSLRTDGTESYSRPRGGVNKALKAVLSIGFHTMLYHYIQIELIYCIAIERVADAYGTLHRRTVHESLKSKSI